MLKQRFFAKVRKTNFCWYWEGARVAQYGQIKVSNKNVLAHRVSMLIHGKEVPDGLDVLHSCDNPLCVNPDHLFVGDHKANMADKTAKGRAPSKLTAEQVRAIKKALSAGQSCNSLAIQFGVVPHTIRDIRDNVTWRQVTT